MQQDRLRVIPNVSDQTAGNRRTKNGKLASNNSKQLNFKRWLKNVRGTRSACLQQQEKDIGKRCGA
jgi:hypothetical protein